MVQNDSFQFFCDNHLIVVQYINTAIHITVNHNKFH